MAKATSRKHASHRKTRAHHASKSAVKTRSRRTSGIVIGPSEPDAFTKAEGTDSESAIDDDAPRLRPRILDEDVEEEKEDQGIQF
jgi:hypothetical protein